MTPYQERGITFVSGQNQLLGVAAIPDLQAEVSVLFLVGGPQYRAGSHRQFTLLARKLAEQGVASLRFDYPGMGDSEGEPVSFEDCAGDVAAALEVLTAHVPSAKRVVLWGLCDAASTAMMFGHQLPQVNGMILVNPWVHGGEYSPGFRISHYYRPLLTEKGYWKRLFKGQVNIAPAFLDAMKAVTGLGRRGRSALSGQQGFVDRMLLGAENFAHETLFILSENDLTAREFQSVAHNSGGWQAVLARQGSKVTKIPGADHTFSRAIWRDQVTAATLEWLKGLS